jgi:hypothetical protein
VSKQDRYPSSWRVFRAHPALGLEEEPLLRPQPRELGAAWLALDLGEQHQREADLEAALRAAAGPDSGWAIELVEDYEVLALAMDRWKAPALERELLDHVWEEARRREAAADVPPVRRRREIDRTLRAHVLVAWDRHAFKAFIAAMAFAGLLGLHPWGDRSVGAVAVRVAVAVVVLIALGKLVERWYHRSARAPE